MESTPPPVSDNGHASLLLLLIKEDLKAHKLSVCFQGMGFATNPYLPDLTEVVLDLAGFSERPASLYTFYYTLLDKHCAVLTGSRAQITEAVSEIAAALQNKHNEHHKNLMSNV